MLSDRSLGWLRYLDRKASTPDNWHRNGQPHSHWDNRTGQPIAARHRGDLVDSSYALGLMALRTPAWTERYVAILDQLIERHTMWWSAADWLTQIGHDPDRADPPEHYRPFVPEALWGNYDLPGWAANGIEPYGVQVDPIAADGMTGYTGLFLVLLGIRSMITDDDRWNRPFVMIGDLDPELGPELGRDLGRDLDRDRAGVGGDEPPTWTHTGIAEHLSRQWAANPVGGHCENTKVWPHRLAGAGLGLRFHDLRYGTDLHQRAFGPWWHHARTHYLDLAGSGLPAATTLYYDPVLDVHHRLPPGAGLPTAFLAAPQVPDDARRLFHAGWTALGLSTPPQLPIMADRAYAAALVLAREWDLGDLAERLSDAIEASYEPTWDDDPQEFTWGMGLGEAHPRGRMNAVLAAAEAGGAGLWSQLATAPIERCPQIVGVDFPDVALRRAEWVNGCLHLGLAPRQENPRRWTTFRLVGAEPRMWYLTGIDGATMDTAGSAVVVRVPMVAGELEFAPSSY